MAMSKDTILIAHLAHDVVVDLNANDYFILHNEFRILRANSHPNSFFDLALPINLNSFHDFKMGTTEYY